MIHTFNFRKLKPVLLVILVLTLVLALKPVNNVLKVNLKNTIVNDSIRELKIDSILNLLTLDEKIDLIHAQSKFSTAGVARLGIPELWMSDGPHGIRAEISWDDWSYAGWTNDSITAFPNLNCLAATFNPKLAKLYGESLGEEALYRKKDIVLGPGVNIYRTPLNGRNFEYMGEDPYLASIMSVPYIQGLQSKGVAACLKHYALNNQEIDRMSVEVHVSKRALFEIYLPAFKAAVQKGHAWSIMGAYNKYLGEFCCHNDYLLNQVLKKDWQFDGAVITDWGGAHNTKQAILNGLDIEMGTGTDGLTYSLKNAYDNYFMAIPFSNKIKSGEIDKKYLDDKVRRVLRLRLRTNMSSNRPMGRMNNIEHLQVARKIATEGIVLLKNKDNFFPIKSDTKMTIAIIGENATRNMSKGGGSSELKPKKEISPLTGIKNRYKNATILYAMGYGSGESSYGKVNPSPYDAKKLKSEALAIAAKADIVLFVGGLNKSHQQDCENGDRTQYGLPFGQGELITEISKINKNIGVILISGNAVAMPWLNNVKTVMQSWYLGSQAGLAIADVLSGAVNPSGKLPYTFPVKLEDNAAIYFGKMSYPGDGVNEYYKEGILVGYRWHDTKKIKPQFAFGFGLSYSSFKISEVASDKKKYTSNDTIMVSCNLDNIGKLKGSEVVQVYVGKPKSKVKRALKELKGFKKVALKSGESNSVNIKIAVSDLKFYDESQSDWHLEKGTYKIYVGNASDNITKTFIVNIQ